MADQIYSYQNPAGSLYFYGSNEWGGQKFTVPAGYTKIAYVQIYMYRTGSPGTTIYGQLCADSGGYPGTVLSQTSKSANTISTGAHWETFDFADYTVTPGGTYHIKFGTFGPNSSNIIKVYAGTTGSGFSAYYYDGGSRFWHTNYGSYDNWLVVVYGYGKPTASATTTSSVGETSMYVSSSIPDDYGATISERGFVYSTTDTTPDVGDSKKVVAGTTGTVATTLTGLTAGTTYYISSYATNAAGTTYGTPKTQATAKNAPSVSTNPATDIGQFIATFNGNVTSDHGATITERGFCYNETGNPNINDDTKRTVSGTTGVYEYDQTGLTPATTYYVKAFATNSEGTSYGAEVEVTTLAGVPSVTTGSTSSLTDTTVTLGGNVTSEGGDTVTERGVAWDTAASPTKLDDYDTTTGTTGAYTVDVTGLEPGTDYYYAAFATNSYGTTYGDDGQFTTEPTEPDNIELTVLGKTSIDIEWTKGAGADTTIVRRSTGSYPTGPTDGDSVYNGAGTSTTDTGLSAGTTYYYRIWSQEGGDNESTGYDEATATTHYSFTNPDEAYADDTTYATAPANDDSIYIQLSKDGGTTWQTELEATLPASDGDVTFGLEDEELWGSTWTGDDVDDTSFAMRVTVGSNKTSYHTFTDFGFSIGSTYVLTGIEVVVNGYFDTDTAYIDLIKTKIHYGTSPIPIKAGTQAYDSTDSVLTYYNGSAWVQVPYISTDDVLVVPTYERHIQIPAMLTGNPANQPAAVDNYTVAGLQWPTTGSKYAFCQWEVPDDWAGDDMTFEIDWYPDSGAMSGTDTIKWDVEYACVAEGENHGGTSTTVSVTNSDDNTQYYSVHSPVTLDYDDANNPLTKQDHIYFKISRDTSVANDFAGTVVVPAFEIIYNSTSIPTGN